MSTHTPLSGRPRDIENESPRRTPSDRQKADGGKPPISTSTPRPNDRRAFSARTAKQRSSPHQGSVTTSGKVKKSLTASNLATFSPLETMVLPTTPSSSRLSTSGPSRIQSFSITFPPGPMGVEFQSKSSGGDGCVVYRISERHKTSLIPGDRVVAIDDCHVGGQRFSVIIDELRKHTARKRTIVFERRSQNATEQLPTPPRLNNGRLNNGLAGLPPTPTDELQSQQSPRSSGGRGPASDAVFSPPGCTSMGASTYEHRDHADGEEPVEGASDVGMSPAVWPKQKSSTRRRSAQKGQPRTPAEAGTPKLGRTAAAATTTLTTTPGSKTVGENSSSVTPTTVRVEAPLREPSSHRRRSSREHKSPHHHHPSSQTSGASPRQPHRSSSKHATLPTAAEEAPDADPNSLLLSSSVVVEEAPLPPPMPTPGGGKLFHCSDGLQIRMEGDDDDDEESAAEVESFSEQQQRQPADPVVRDGELKDRQQHKREVHGEHSPHEEPHRRRNSQAKEADEAEEDAPRRQGWLFEDPTNAHRDGRSGGGGCIGGGKEHRTGSNDSTISALTSRGETPPPSRPTPPTSTDSDMRRATKLREKKNGSHHTPQANQNHQKQMEGGSGVGDVVADEEAGDMKELSGSFCTEATSTAAAAVAGEEIAGQHHGDAAAMGAAAIAAAASLPSDPASLVSFLEGLTRGVRSTKGQQQQANRQGIVGSKHQSSGGQGAWSGHSGGGCDGGVDLLAPPIESVGPPPTPPPAHGSLDSDGGGVRSRSCSIRNSLKARKEGGGEEAGLTPTIGGDDDDDDGGSTPVEGSNQETEVAVERADFLFGGLEETQQAGGGSGGGGRGAGEVASARSTHMSGGGDESATNGTGACSPRLGSATPARLVHAMTNAAARGGGGPLSHLKGHLPPDLFARWTELLILSSSSSPTTLDPISDRGNRSTESSPSPHRRRHHHPNHDTPPLQLVPTPRAASASSRVLRSGGPKGGCGGSGSVTARLHGELVGAAGMLGSSEFARASAEREASCLRSSLEGALKCSEALAGEVELLRKGGGGGGGGGGMPLLEEGGRGFDRGVMEETRRMAREARDAAAKAAAALDRLRDGTFYRAQSSNEAAAGPKQEEVAPNSPDPEEDRGDDNGDNDEDEDALGQSLALTWVEEGGDPQGSAVNRSFSSRLSVRIVQDSEEGDEDDEAETGDEEEGEAGVGDLSGHPASRALNESSASPAVSMTPSDYAVAAAHHRAMTLIGQEDGGSVDGSEEASARSIEGVCRSGGGGEGGGGGLHEKLETTSEDRRGSGAEEWGESQNLAAGPEDHSTTPPCSPSQPKAKKSPKKRSPISRSPLPPSTPTPPPRIGQALPPSSSAGKAKRGKTSTKKGLSGGMGSPKNKTSSRTSGSVATAALPEKKGVKAASSPKKSRVHGSFASGNGSETYSPCRPAMTSAEWAAVSEAVELPLASARKHALNGLVHGFPSPNIMGDNAANQEITAEGGDGGGGRKLFPNEPAAASAGELSSSSSSLVQGKGSRGEASAGGSERRQLLSDLGLLGSLGRLSNDQSAAQQAMVGSGGGGGAAASAVPSSSSFSARPPPANPFMDAVTGCLETAQQHTLALDVYTAARLASEEGPLDVSIYLTDSEWGELEFDRQAEGEEAEEARKLQQLMLTQAQDLASSSTVSRDDDGGGGGDQEVEVSTEELLMIGQGEDGRGILMSPAPTVRSRPNSHVSSAASSPHSHVLKEAEEGYDQQRNIGESASFSFGNTTAAVAATAEEARASPLTPPTPPIGSSNAPLSNSTFYEQQDGGDKSGECNRGGSGGRGESSSTHHVAAPFTWLVGADVFQGEDQSQATPHADSMLVPATAVRIVGQVQDAVYSPSPPSSEHTQSLLSGSGRVTGVGSGGGGNTAFATSKIDPAATASSSTPRGGVSFTTPLLTTVAAMTTAEAEAQVASQGLEAIKADLAAALAGRDRFQVLAAEKGLALEEKTQELEGCKAHCTTLERRSHACATRAAVAEDATSRLIQELQIAKAESEANAQEAAQSEVAAAAASASAASATAAKEAVHSQEVQQLFQQVEELKLQLEENKRAAKLALEAAGSRHFTELAAKDVELKEMRDSLAIAAAAGAAAAASNHEAETAAAVELALASQAQEAEARRIQEVETATKRADQAQAALKRAEDTNKALLLASASASASGKDFFSTATPTKAGSVHAFPAANGKRTPISMPPVLGALQPSSPPLSPSSSSPVPSPQAPPPPFSHAPSPSEAAARAEVTSLRAECVRLSAKAFETESDLGHAQEMLKSQARSHLEQLQEVQRLQEAQRAKQRGALEAASLLASNRKKDREDETFAIEWGESGVGGGGSPVPSMTSPTPFKRTGDRAATLRPTSPALSHRPVPLFSTPEQQSRPFDDAATPVTEVQTEHKKRRMAELLGRMNLEDGGGFLLDRLLSPTSAAAAAGVEGARDTAITISTTLAASSAGASAEEAERECSIYRERVKELEDKLLLHQQQQQQQQQQQWMEQQQEEDDKAKAVEQEKKGAHRQHLVTDYVSPPSSQSDPTANGVISSASTNVDDLGYDDDDRESDAGGDDDDGAAAAQVEWLLSRVASLEAEAADAAFLAVSAAAAAEKAFLAELEGEQAATAAAAKDAREAQARVEALETTAGELRRQVESLKALLQEVSEQAFSKEEEEALRRSKEEALQTREALEVELESLSGALKEAEGRVAVAEAAALEASSEAQLAVAAAAEAVAAAASGGGARDVESEEIADAVAAAVSEVEDSAVLANEQAWAEAEQLRSRLEEALLTILSLKQALEQQALAAAEEGENKLGGTHGLVTARDDTRQRRVGNFDGGDDDASSVGSGGVSVGGLGIIAPPRSPEALLLAEEEHMKLEAQLDAEKKTVAELKKQVVSLNAKLSGHEGGGDESSAAAAVAVDSASGEQVFSASNEPSVANLRLALDAAHAETSEAKQRCAEAEEVAGELAATAEKAAAAWTSVAASNQESGGDEGVVKPEVVAALRFALDDALQEVEELKLELNAAEELLQSSSEGDNETRDGGGDSFVNNNDDGDGEQATVQEECTVAAPTPPPPPFVSLSEEDQALLDELKLLSNTCREMLQGAQKEEQGGSEEKEPAAAAVLIPTLFLASAGRTLWAVQTRLTSELARAREREGAMPTQRLGQQQSQHSTAAASAAANVSNVSTVGGVGLNGRGVVSLRVRQFEAAAVRAAGGALRRRRRRRGGGGGGGGGGENASSVASAISSLAPSSLASSLDSLEEGGSQYTRHRDRNFLHFRHHPHIVDPSAHAHSYVAMLHALATSSEGSLSSSLSSSLPSDELSNESSSQRLPTVPASPPRAMATTTTSDAAVSSITTPATATTAVTTTGLSPVARVELSKNSSDILKASRRLREELTAANANAYRARSLALANTVAAARRKEILRVVRKALVQWKKSGSERDSSPLNTRPADLNSLGASNSGESTPPERSFTPSSSLASTSALSKGGLSSSTAKAAAVPSLSVLSPKLPSPQRSLSPTVSMSSPLDTALMRRKRRPKNGSAVAGGRKPSSFPLPPPPPPPPPPPLPPTSEATSEASSGATTDYTSTLPITNVKSVVRSLAASETTTARSAASPGTSAQVTTASSEKKAPSGQPRAPMTARSNTSSSAKPATKGQLLPLVTALAARQQRLARLADREGEGANEEEGDGGIVSGVGGCAPDSKRFARTQQSRESDEGSSFWALSDDEN